MRVVVLAFLAVSTLASAQNAGVPEKPAPKKDPKAEEKEKAKPKPRIGVQKDGAGGGDAQGRAGPSSLGGTPGTPSGSFPGGATR